MNISIFFLQNYFSRTKIKLLHELPKINQTFHEMPEYKFASRLFLKCLNYMITD